MQELGPVGPIFYKAGDEVLVTENSREATYLGLHWGAVTTQEYHQDLSVKRGAGGIIYGLLALTEAGKTLVKTADKVMSMHYHKSGGATEKDFAAKPSF